jgi:hypothetical protein
MNTAVGQMPESVTSSKHSRWNSLGLIPVNYIAVEPNQYDTSSTLVPAPFKQVELVLYNNWKIQILIEERDSSLQFTSTYE